MKVTNHSRKRILSLILATTLVAPAPTQAGLWDYVSNVGTWLWGGTQSTTSSMAKTAAITLSLGAAAYETYKLYKKYNPDIVIEEYKKSHDQISLNALISEARSQLGAWSDDLAKESKFFVIKVKNKIIGFVQYKFYKETLFDTNIGYIHNLAIDRQYRNQGFGKQLLSYAINCLKKIGANKIMLSVLNDNVKAMKFYTKYGFVASKPLYYCTRFSLPIDQRC